MNKLFLGERVKIHGEEGSVEWLGASQFGVRFNDGRKVLSRRDVYETDSQEDAQEQELRPFVVQEPDGEDSLRMVSRWKPFFDNFPEVILRNLHKISQSARPHGGYSEFFRSKNPAPPLGPESFMLFAGSGSLPGEVGKLDFPGISQFDASSSAAQNGLGLVICIGQEGGEPIAFGTEFPMCLHGSQHRLRLEQIYVWDNGIEAQIECSLGPASITFYDTDFVNNQEWYAEHAEHEFLLIGIAYDAAPSVSHEFIMERDEEYFEAMQWLTGQDCRPEDGSMTELYSMDGMASLLPLGQLDRDDYQFCGPIQTIRREVMLGQPVWRMRVTVLREAESDMNLDIIVTQRVWRGTQEPQVGDNIQGVLWLQGRMWMNCSSGKIRNFG